jgi:hypothetical protein
MNRCVVVLVVSLILVRADIPAQAQVEVQSEVLVIEGRVLWMSAQKMIVAPPNDLAVDVNLSRISQADLRNFRQNDYVVVWGQLLRPTRTVLAFSIRWISPWYPQAP